MANVDFPMKQFRCPNGLLVWNTPKSRDETNFIYREIFEQRCYERHGVTVSDGSVILDAGANVGFFTLSLLERFRDLKVICFEPVPNTRACLERNVEESPWRSGHDITISGYAVGSKNGEAVISYFPQATLNSTLHLEEKRSHWNTLADGITSSQIRKWNKVYALAPRRIVAWFMRPMINDVVQIQCKVCTLSDTMRERGLARVDLLKIDVEGAELDALQGIEEQHWPLIKQLVMEIEPANKVALPELVERLLGFGFTKITVESADGGECLPADPMPCTLYAVRMSSEA
jgi:FkbM family methyltransferase